MIKKFILYFSLVLTLAVAGVYATTPWWFSVAISKQLPPGWQLEALEAGYPGLSGIDINALVLRGELQAADLTVSVADLYLGYEGLKTTTTSVVVDVYLRASETAPEKPDTLKNLSFPVARFSRALPGMTVSQLRANLHYGTDIDHSNTNPLVLLFERFDLTPSADDEFHLETQVYFEQYPEAAGRISVDAKPGRLDADIQFIAESRLSPWLTLTTSQLQATDRTTTDLTLKLDTEYANQEWLDLLLQSASHDVMRQMQGRLEINADFAGQDLQKIQHFSMHTEALKMIFNDGEINLNTGLVARHDAENIFIELTEPGRVSFMDKTGMIDSLFTQLVPEFQRPPRLNTTISAEISSGSSFLYQPGTTTSIGFEGDINGNLTSDGESLKFHGEHVKARIADISKMKSVSADGLLSLEWLQNVAFSYTTETLDLIADTFSVATVIRSQDGKFTSSGDSTFSVTHIPQLDVSANKAELHWQDLDLLARSGNFSLETQGLAIMVDAESWTGFDLNTTGEILKGKETSGTGSIEVTGGPEFPIKFSGDATTGRWDVILLPATIKVSQLRKLLFVGHIELPKSIKLTDGNISLEGRVNINEITSAELLVQGNSMAATMHESSVRKAGFTFNTTVNHTVSANGPVTIENIALAGGLDLSAFNTQLVLENPETIGLQEINAELLGGRVQLDNLILLNNTLQDTTAELIQIKLGSLLEIADIEGLQGTGLLDLSLPLSSDEHGINIRNGTFRSTGPGRLAYVKTGLASTNIGLKALENFQYQDLSGTVNYQSDGSYLISAHLEGKNPDLYGGHPVVFNLNINGGLPTLFESLFITGDFEEAILNEVRKK